MFNLILKEMKKILFVIVTLLASLSVSAQIFDTLEKRDKFDDVLKRETIKTLVTFTDSIITIETKGRKAQDYIVVNVADYGCKGDEDNIVNLVNDVWGYQKCWCVVKSEDGDAFLDAYHKVMKEELPTETLNKYWRWITDRVVTTRYTHTFEDRIVWVNEPDQSRIIYYNK